MGRLANETIQKPEGLNGASVVSLGEYQPQIVEALKLGVLRKELSLHDQTVVSRPQDKDNLQKSILHTFNRDQVRASYLKNRNIKIRSDDNKTCSFIAHEEVVCADQLFHKLV